MKRFGFLTCAIAIGLLTLLMNQNLSAAEMLHARSRASATQTINFEVYLRTRNQPELDQLLTAQTHSRKCALPEVAGDFVGVIGTSAAAPGFAGILALKEENLGGIRLGNENFDIYALAAAQELLGPVFKVYRQNIDGFNGVFSTNRGYDQVLGNGTPIVKNFVLAPAAPSAGDPQTPSNP